MKYTKHLLLGIWVSTATVMAQTDARITNLLRQFPAQNAKQQQKNMDDMAALGKAGIAAMASQLSSPDKGEHAKVQYAISGFTYYVTQSGKEEGRQMAAEAYVDALPRVADKNNQAFLIYQLQQVGKDEVIGTLANYLTDIQLSGPSARALSKIGTKQAGKTLTQALANASGDAQIFIIEALGDAKIEESAPAIEKIAAGASANLQKVALYALAQIGAPSSSGVLSTAAAKAGYSYDLTNATASYLTYLARLVENGQKVLAVKNATALLKSAISSKHTPTRTAALKILAEAQGVLSVPTLRKAVQSLSIEERIAALKLAQKLLTPATAQQWITALPNFKPEAQAEIITMMGQAEAKTALPALLKQLSNKESVIKIAAIDAVAKIGQESVLKNLLEVLKKSSDDEVKAIKTALLSLKGENVVNQAAAALPTLPPNAQVALLDLLAARAADSKIDVVSGQLKNNNANVKNAAFSALRRVSMPKDLPMLYELLGNVSDSDEQSATQEAITAALKNTGNANQQTDLLLGQINNVGADKKPAYLSVLANIGTRKALQFVSTSFSNGSASSQQAALAALAHWSDASAITELNKIGKSTTDPAYTEQAVAGIIRAVTASKQNATQRVLSLRKALEIAKTSAQKESVLKELVRNRTFNALLLAGPYLEDASLQQTAAQVVLNAAFANKDFQGEVIRSFVTKAMNVISNDTQKEAARKYLSEMPKGEGFVSLFNGKDLTGWKGLVANPIARAKMHPDTLAAKQAKADEVMRKGWVVKDGELVFTGHGDNLCTVKKYGDFEMYVDWKIEPKGDAGIYLRGSPQVQVWDTSRVEVGAQVGSGGLYNNQKNPSKPLKLADNAINDWNTFHIIMKADRVTVYLNGELVVDNVVLENYWDRKQPIFAMEQLELQAHGTLVAYRDIYVKELPRPEPFALSEQEKKENFKVLFDGTNMFEWQGNTTDYVIENGEMVVYPNRGGKGNLYTKDEYSDFEFRFEFLLTPGANNGLGIRAPLQGDAAYVGTELQILDNEADIYKSLQPYQYHGSAYGIIPAKRGFLKPVGEWNYQEVVVKGSKVKVTLNGTVIMEGDLAEASKNGTADHRDHPGLSRTSGYIGFLGHGDTLRFRNIRIKDLTVPTPVEQPIVEEKAPEKKGKKRK